MKITEILEIANAPLTEAQYLPMAAVIETKLREIMELMPDIIRTVKLSSYHTDYNLEAKLNNWLED